MADTLAEARAAVHTAALAKENLLHRAIEGEQVTDDEMLAADQAEDRAERLLKLAEAMAVGAQHRAQLNQVEGLRKDAVVLEQNYVAGIDRLIEISEVVDEKLADAQEALSALYEQAAICQAAHRAAVYHNTTSINYNHNHNAALRDMPPANQPKVWNIPQVFGVPRVRVELVEDVAVGSISQRRIVHHALTPRLRLDHKRPIAKDRAA
jgi:hypothetical protein